MPLQTLILRYGAFAVIATIANLAVQRLVLRFGDGGLYLTVAIVSGTAVGLLIKYILDKRWIFYDASPDHSRQFSLYTLMGIVTTAIF